MDFIAFIRGYAEYIILFGSVSVALAAIWSKLVKPAGQKIMRTQAIFSKLAIIATELRPNGGSTLRDAIDRIEARQVKEHQLIHTILLDSERGLFECDKHGHCIWTNPKMLSMSGSSVLGLDWLNAISSESRASIREEWFDAVADSRAFFSVVTFVREDGSRLKASCKIRPLKVDGSEVIGWLGTCVPVTIDKEHHAEALS